MDNGAKSEGKKPVWIAIYTRKSNDENLNIEVTSIDNQKGCCRSYIEIQKEKGWKEYPEAFDDPAESGKSLERPAMRRLLQRIQEGKVQGIIVYKLDRLTRNSRDFHGLVELFEKHGVAFVSATESIDTKSPQGRLMTGIMVQFAAYDRELDQERSRDTHLARERKGLWCAGLPPLGYDLKDKLLVVNQAEAELVRMIFGLYLKHKSTLVVADELNRLGYRRKTHKMLNGKLFGGQAFDPHSVTRILQRKVYIGFVTNKRTGQEFAGQHQPIVGPRVFEKAQQLMEAHRKREGTMLYAKNKHGFRLKGLIRCGVCKSAMVGFVQPKKGRQYRYYRCIGRNPACPVKCIGSDKIEEFVIEKLAALGKDRALLEKMVGKVETQCKKQIRPMKRERRLIEERIKQSRREAQNLLNMVKAGGESQEAMLEIRRLEGARRELEARAAELDAQVGARQRAVYDVDAIQGALLRFARFIRRMPNGYQVLVMRILLKQVNIFRWEMTVETHELPVGALHVALDKKLWAEPRGLGHWVDVANGTAKDEQAGAVVRNGANGATSGEHGPNGTAETPVNGAESPKTKPPLPQNGEGTAVCVSRENWRGRREQTIKISVRPLVPNSPNRRNNALFPIFCP